MTPHPDSPKISLVIASYNRAYTLRQVLPSFFEQRDITEIILVNDTGEDETEQLFAEVAARYPHVKAIHLRMPAHSGQPACRNAGAKRATQDFVLFCDDDLFLGPDYGRNCLALLRKTGASAVGGRYMRMLPNETPEQTRARFGSGWIHLPYFDQHLFHVRNTAHFGDPVKSPLISSVFVTPKALLMQYGFDPFYRRGNGYREESDYQANLFVNGHDLFVTNDAWCAHLPMHEVPTGGQRTSRIKFAYYAIRYTFYFYDKYYDAIAQRLKFTRPKWRAKLDFARYAFDLHCWRPFYRDRIKPALDGWRRKAS